MSRQDTEQGLKGFYCSFVARLAGRATPESPPRRINDS